MTEAHPMTSIDKLEPCPWCGQTLELVESMAKAFDPPQLYREYHHRNSECILNTRHWTFSPEREEARQAFIAAWNTRASSQAPADVVERVKQAIKEPGRYLDFTGDHDDWKARAAIAALGSHNG